MSNIFTSYSNSVEFYLSVTGYKPLKIKEPEGWNEDGIEFARHDNYHGIFTSFTNNLTFYKDSRDFIINAFDIYGINCDLFLIKKELNDFEGEIKFVESYRALADFKTLQEKEGGVQIKFNSNQLSELIKSHENDKFEVERFNSIDDKNISTFTKNLLNIQGRSIQLKSESVIKKIQPKITEKSYPINYGTIEDYSYIMVNGRSIPVSGPIQTNEWVFAITPISTVLNFGVERFASSDTGFFVKHLLNQYNDTLTASNLIYVNVEDSNVLNASVDVKYSFNINYSCNDQGTYYIPGENIFAKLKISKLSYDSINGKYEIVEERLIYEKYMQSGQGQSGSTRYINDNVVLSGIENFDVAYNEALVAYIEFGGKIECTVSKWDIKLDEVALTDVSVNLSFGFYHDVWDRILEIMTGRKNVFYSKFFGRKEIGYKQDGFGGLIGLIHGYWIREFNPNSEKYKSLTTSHKELLSSSEAVFNVGMGIEKFGLQEKVRIEEVSHFYRSGSFIVLKKQVQDERKVVANNYFSGLEFGYRKGGDYEDEQGLDEPNTRSEWVTPIRKSDKKYSKLSSFRSDEYGLERTRRKPQSLFPNEDTRGDSDIWLIDLKRSQNQGLFEQKSWEDRLQKLPSGIFSPETYKSALFTPLRMLFRHANMFMSGIETYRDKIITYTNGVANVVLKTLFIGEQKEFQENQQIKVKDLKKALTLPIEIKFNYPYDQDLINLIKGFRNEIVNGEEEMVPNYYYEITFTNRFGIKEKGFLKSLKVSKQIEITLIKSNENKI